MRGLTVSLDFWNTIAYDATRTRKQAQLAAIANDLFANRLAEDALRASLDALIAGPNAFTGAGLLRAVADRHELPTSDEACMRIATRVSEIATEFPPKFVEGLSEVLERLSSRSRLVLSSNTYLTSGDSIREIMSVQGILGHFVELNFSDEVRAVKQDPSFFKDLLLRNPGDLVHVGDSEHLDMAPAKLAGATPILARTLPRPYVQRKTTASAITYDIAGIPLVQDYLSAPEALAPKATGLGICGSIVVGRAHLVRGRAPGSVPVGRVLMFGTTVPEYEEYFQSAAAVVTETGGYGSHAAHFAPYVGVACVIGAANIRSRVSDGDLVVVDPQRGVILGRSA